MERVICDVFHQMDGIFSWMTQIFLNRNGAHKLSGTKYFADKSNTESKFPICIDGSLARGLCHSLIWLIPLIFLLTHIFTRRHHTSPIVGRGIYRWSSLAALYSRRKLFQAGFKKYPNSAFCVHVFPFGRVTVLTKQELIEEMKCAPVDALSFDEVSHALILPKYTCFGDAPDHHPIMVIRHDFSRKLNSLLPNILTEIASAMDVVLNRPTGAWHDIVLQNLVTEITSRVSLHVLVGAPLCYNPELKELIVSFALGATRTAFWINLFPQVLHSIVGPLISSMNHDHKRLQQMITPTIDERRQKLKELGEEWVDKPTDYLMCLIESAPHGQNYESSYEGIAARLLQFGFASIHTSINALSHLLLDLTATPSTQDALREEIHEMIGGSGLTKQSMQKLHRMDSFLRESARLSPVGISTDRLCSIGLTNLSRFARRTYIFSDGKTFIPKGSVVMAPLDAVHRNEKAFMHQYVSTSPNYLAFGHGKRACPGRFFASLELKAALYYILLNYDLKARDGVRPPNDDMGIGVLPDVNARIMVRTRMHSSTYGPLKSETGDNKDSAV